MITSISQLDLDKQYSYEDYLIWELEERVELLQGKIRPIEPPSRRHQAISMKLTRPIVNALWKSPCKVYAAPFDVRITRFNQAQNKDVTTVVQPDLCVICDPSKLDDRGCLGAPELMIEILSPGNSKTEMKDKFEIYEEAGVLEYWIVSPVEKTIQVWKLNEQGKYIGLQPAVEDDILTTSIIPGLEIEVTDVFLD